MKHLFITILFFAALSVQATAQKIITFPKGEKATNTEDFTGTIWLNHVNGANSSFNYNIATATYAPGSKLDWHIHPGGQILFITEGTGYYQERGKPVQIVHQGDVIKCPPGVEHWHGSTPESSFAYLAITANQPTKWLEPVSEEKYKSITPSAASNTNIKQKIKNLSEKKWEWMAEKNVEALDELFSEKSMFVHMGGTWGKDQELATIESGGIWYKKAVVYDKTVHMFGNTAIMLSNMDLVAMVGGNKVTSAFMVTEVYNKKNDEWKLGQLTFSHLLRDVKINNNDQ